MPALALISHHLCPYVQRAAIALAEKGVPFNRDYVDLAAKPGWFLAVSLLGKTPVLLVDNQPIFESAAILEYLEDTLPPPLHPADPLQRAQHRGWIEFGSTVLNDIAGFYNAPDARALIARAEMLERRFAQLEVQLDDQGAVGPWFAGRAFSLVDTVFAPVFRYFDTFDRIRDFGILSGKPGVLAWRSALASRPSVQAAVGDDYAERLTAFLHKRGSALSAVMQAPTPV